METNRYFKSLYYIECTHIHRNSKIIIIILLSIYSASSWCHKKSKVGSISQWTISTVNGSLTSKINLAVHVHAVKMFVFFHWIQKIVYDQDQIQLCTYVVRTSVYYVDSIPSTICTKNINSIKKNYVLFHSLIEQYYSFGRLHRIITNQSGNYDRKHSITYAYNNNNILLNQ